MKLHFQSPEIASNARAAVAEVWSLADRCLGLPEGGRRATIHIYNDLVACSEVSARHGKAWDRNAFGFVVFARNEAHVLYARGTWCRDLRWRIGYLTMKLALRQATKLPEAQWPAIAAEGLCRFAEGSSIYDVDGPYKGHWIEPRHDFKQSDSRLLLQRLHRQERLPAFTDQKLAGLNVEEALALHRHRVRFLMAEQPQAACAAFRAALAATDRTLAEKAFVQVLQAQLGESATNRLDEAFVKYLEGLPDRLMMDVDKQKQAVDPIASADYVPPAPWVMWFDKNRKSRFVLTASPQFVQNSQADVVFERRNGAWVRVSMEARDERSVVAVSRRVVTKGEGVRWQVLARTDGDVPEIRAGRSIDVKVAADGKNVAVSIAGREVVRATLPSGNLSGRYGVGQPPWCHNAWRKVRVR